MRKAEGGILTTRVRIPDSAFRDLAILSSTPLTNRADSAEPNRDASSFASLMTTSTGSFVGANSNS